MTKTTPPEQRFWAKVNKDGPIPAHRPELGHCWVWLATRVKNGYGQFYVGGTPRTKSAHRFSYEVSVGPIPDGLDLDHVCRNTSCVRPSHLEPVTHAVNVERGISGDRVRAYWAAQTHCKYGHEWNEENTMRVPNSGRRRCYLCYLNRSLEASRKRTRERLLAQS